MSLFRTLFGAHARRQIRQGLDGLWVSGLEAAMGASQDRPVVFAATHVAFWDGLLLFPLDDALGRRGRVWMDAENLRRLSFFARLGAMPLDRRSPAGRLASVRTALHWLSEPGRQLWVFPQGKQTPHWLRPIRLEPGAAWLAERTGAHLVPVAMAYGFADDARPRAVVSFGEPVPPAHLEGGLLQALARTDRFLDGCPAGFEALVGGARARPDAGLGTRLLSAAAAPQGASHAR